ncbi:MAG TPA: cold-shock protein, partial [Phycisphaerae bacterium]
GTVKWYDCKKGFGFIIDPSGEDVLAHYSVIEATGFRRLFDGEKVEYEARRGPRGLNATRVKQLEPRPPRSPRHPHPKRPSDFTFNLRSNPQPRLADK